MKPDFALLLSFDGIALLRRAAAYGEPEDGWYVLGTVAPSVSDMNAALAEVRARAVEIAPGGDPEVKLVLPSEQVKFLDIDKPGTDVPMARAVEIALDGATPYAIDELVYDFHVDGDRLHIAAVARETLDEAESFATSNGFMPLGYVSDIAEGAGFGREPFFGPTQQALTTLTPGVTVQGDESPIVILDGPPPAEATAAQDQPAKTSAEASAAEPQPAPDAPAKVEDTAEPAPTDMPPETSAQEAPKQAPAKAPEPAETAVAASKPANPAAKTEKPAPKAKPAVETDTKPAKAEEKAKPAEPQDTAKPEETAKPKDAPAKPAAKQAKPAPRQTEAAKPKSDAKPTQASKPEKAPEKLVAGSEAKPVASSDAKPAHPEAKQAKPADTPQDRPKPGPKGVKPAPKPKPADKPAPLKEATAPKPAPQPKPGDKPLRAGPTAAAKPVPPAPSPLPADAASDNVKAPGFSSIRANRDTPPPRPGAALNARPEPAVTPPLPPVTPSNPQDPTKELAAKARDSLTQRPRILPVPPAPESAGPETASPGAPDAANGTAPDPADGGGKTIGFASRRATGKKQAKKPPKPASRTPRFGKTKTAAAAATATGAVLDESERMTVFGARGQQKIGGKPRFLGLILTTILLLLLLAVAAVASIFLDDGLAGLFRRSSEAPIATAAVPDAIESTPIDPPLAAPATAPEPVPETALALPETVELEDPSAINLAALNAGVPAMSRDLVEDQIDGLSVPFEAETLSPEQAEARYAATGIWQRAPLPPLEPAQTPVGDVYVASIDPSVSVGDAVAIPTSREAATDLAPPHQSNPSPPDAGLTFDENGLIEATPEGVRHPEGFLLVLGPPPVRPPLRPGSDAPTPAALPAETGAEPGAAGSPPAGRAALPPPAPPENLTEGRAAPAEGAAPVVVDTTLSGLRPRPRPADLEEQNERANLGGISREELRQKRPRARPDLPDDKTEAEKVVAASALAVAASVAPKRRPANIQALVRQAQRNAANRQQTAAAAPAAVAPRKVTPRIPSSTTVAAAATEKNAINLRRVNLIGVYGKPSSRRALIRLSNGRYKKVKVGDRIDGGRVSAISDGQLSYVKSGRNVVLRMPRG